jgi:hypothetical protein
LQAKKSHFFVFFLHGLCYLEKVLVLHGVNPRRPPRFWLDGVEFLLIREASDLGEEVSRRKYVRVKVTAKVKPSISPIALDSHQQLGPVANQ